MSRPIRHVGNVSFGKEDEQTCIKNILHVLTITKNLVLVGQIVEQGMQVRFNQGDCFIEKKGRLIVCGRREGRMFILESNEVRLAMFAKGLKVDTDIELWATAQKNHPYQSKQTQGHAIKRSRH